MYLLDSDTLIFLLRGNNTVAKRFQSESQNSLGTSIINIAELYYGAYKSGNVSKHLPPVQELEQFLTIYYPDKTSASEFGRIKANLELKGQKLPDADLWIAAIAITNRLTLVTHNQKHFSRINSILLEDWVI